jgi:signal transduction histidine kinase
MSSTFAVDDKPVVRGMSLRRAPAAALLAAGAVGSGLTAWAAATSPILSTPGADAVVRGFLVGLYTLAGVYTWRRRPGEPFGPLLVAIGLTYALTSFNTSGDSTLYTLGRLYTAAFYGLLYAAFLSFPSGRLRTGLERTTVAVYALGAGVLWVSVALLAETLPSGGVFSDCGEQCPPNAFRVTHLPSAVGHVPVVALQVLTVGVSAAATLVLVRKARSPIGVERRTVRPVLLAALAIVVAYALFTVHSSGDVWHTLNLVVSGTAAIVLPLAFVLAPLRGELYVSRALWRGLSGLDYARMSFAQVEEICRQALDDPSLRLAVRLPGAGPLCGADGVPVRVPEDGAANGVTWIARAEGSYAVIHDPSLARGYRPVVERLGDLAFTLLEYARAFRDVALSRRRIAANEGEERSQLERDLHDGAQQRLLAIQMKLAALEQSAADTDLAAPIRDVSADAASAMSELRRIAQGINPPLLHERGVGDALRETPAPPPLRLQIVDNGVGRLPAAVERALYFSTAEAIQNATKHSGADAVVVTLESLGGDLVEVTVEDDGAGFDPLVVASGAGLTSIRDRIGSIGGDVEIRSMPGAGTVVRYVVPRSLEPQPVTV